MLNRALAGVTNGFYIDVGAASPNNINVTRAFYESGWHGINIDPNPLYAEQLHIERPRDINLEVAAGDSDGRMTFNLISVDDLSTFDDDIAQMHEASGYRRVRRDVEILSLRTICARHVPDGQEIHFLKVDVEGFEASVLRGNDWSSYRPWIVVIEATIPNTQIDHYQECEDILLDANYDFVYRDGLNRFYLATERDALRPSFKYPPNVFDDFELHALVDARSRLADLGTQVAKLDQQRHRHEAREAHLRYLLHRSFWESALFRIDGRPRKFFRHLLCHRGRPRSIFRSLIFKKNGSYRPAFQYWLTAQRD